jgi:SAM-dependent methyltransferase
MALLRRLLAHPLTRSLDLDDPRTTEIRREVISSKALLKAIYDEWYQMFARELPSGPGEILELGSGAGFCDRFIPGLITSEIFLCSGVRVVLDAERLPFSDGALRAIVMTNVLHHIPNVSRLFVRASQCLRGGGKLLMIEPWVTSWSRFVYKRFHHEDFCPERATWSFPSTGPISSANVALPWIIFQRDRDRFEREFPVFSIEFIRPILPFRYLLSGGISMKAFMPLRTNRAWAGLEGMLKSQMHRLGMFALISVRRN